MKPVSTGLVFIQIDLAIIRENIGGLTEKDLAAACYLRGLNMSGLDRSEADAFLRQCSASGCNQLAYKCQKIENARTFGGMDAICEKVDFYEEVLCETGKTVVPYTKGYLRNHDFEGTYTYVVA